MAATTRAGISERLRFIGIGVAGIARIVHCLWYGEEFACARDVADTRGIGEQTVVTDAMESTGEHMDEEAADKLEGWERHDLGLVAAGAAVILPFESHAGLVEGNETAVGDGDTVGVAGQIGQHRLGAAEGALGVDDPFDLA